MGPTDSTDEHMSRFLAELAFCIALYALRFANITLRGISGFGRSQSFFLLVSTYSVQ